MNKSKSNFDWKFWLMVTIGLAGIFLQALDLVPNKSPIPVIISQSENKIAISDLYRTVEVTIPIPPKKPDIKKLNNTNKQLDKLLAVCLLKASETFKIPAAVLIGLYGVVGKDVGYETKNNDGIYNIGITQVSSSYIPILAKKWGVSEETAKHWIKYDPCTGMGVSAWILREKLTETGTLSNAIAEYLPNKGKAEKEKFRNAVINEIKRKNLIINKD